MTTKTPAKPRAKKAVAEQPKPAEVVVAYKGFGMDWKCRDFQYAVGETYEHKGDVSACAAGFHACEYPLHVLRYYKPGASRFATSGNSGAATGRDRRDGDCVPEGQRRVLARR